MVEPPQLPPPPQPPEPFPGFGRELEQLGISQFKAQTRLMETEKKRATAEQAFILGGRTGFLAQFFRPARKTPLPGGGLSVFPVAVPLEILKQELLQAQQEYDLALQEMKSNRWRQEVMITLPNYLSLPDYKIQSPEDILNYMPLDSMTEADTTWLNLTYDRLKHLSNVLPEGFTGDAMEAQTKVLNEVLTAPKLELRGIHNLTVEELAKSFQFGVAELPQGMSEEDVRSILSQMDLQEEELKDVKIWLTERAISWEIESGKLNLLRAGLVLPEEPELTPWEFTKLAATQPMMATVELLDKYWNMLPRPAVAASIIGFHRLLNLGAATSEGTAAARLEEGYEFYRSMGLSSWDSYAKSFNEWDAPWWLKIAAESAFDPLMYIGFGLTTAAAYKIGTGLTRVGLRTVGTRIGPWVGAFHGGYVAGADAVFKAGVQVFLAPIKGSFWLTGVGYQIPKTATQMARNFARKSIMDFNAVLGRTFPEVRNLKGLTVKDLTGTADNVINQALARPMEGHDLAVRAGANLLEFNYIDDLAARKMVAGVREPILGPTGEVISEVGGEIAFDTVRLARFNNEVLNMFSGQGERITAGKIIADLGQEATEEAVTNVSAKLVTFREKIAKAALVAVKGDAPQDVILNVFNRLEGIRFSNIHSPMTPHMTQAGRSVSWVTRVADKMLYSTQLVALERRLVMPLARWNLLFTNFGPYNFTENMGRSFLGGGEIMYPKSYSGVAETNRLFKGLAGAPYELQLMERGEVRLAQAMIDPKTGKTAVFQRGKVPFVTREVTIPEKVPFLGGKTIGAKINLAGRDHYLASFQDAYDMWGHFNSKQVAFDYQTHYMKSLAEIAPDNMKGLVDNVANHRAELDNISAISSKDARDIERVLLQDSTVGPEAVRAHADLDVLEFERRQVSKELYKTMDRMTDVRAITKVGIRDEVLGGSIFKDIDGRIAAYVESERELSLISLKNQMDVLKKEADTFLANPPRNLNEFLGDMQNMTAMVEGTGERIHDYRKLTELRKARLSPADFDDFEVGSAKLLAEFMETSEEQLTKIMNQLGENARTVVTTNLEPEEMTRLLQSRIRYLAPNEYLRGLGKAPRGREFGLAGQFFTRSLDDAGYYGPSYIRATIKPKNSLDWRGDAQSLADSIGIGKEFGELGGSGHPTAEEFLINKIKSSEQGFDAFRLYADAPGEELIVVLDDSIINISKRFTIGTGESVLNEVQLARLTDLDSISRLELENILATRNKVAGIEAIIPTTPKGKRNERFWQQQRAQKAIIWDEYDGNARKFKSLRLRASRNFLASVDKPVFTPDFVPEVTAELTPNHLAYLYGATGDDLYRGLTRVQHHITIRPREDFILHTAEQADAYAAKFSKTASDMGFTDEAIGEVYDQLWRNQGIEPSILTPDSPTVMQLEEIRQELTRLHGSMKIPDSDLVKWRQYVNSVADDVEKLPMYKVVTTAEAQLERLTGIKADYAKVAVQSARQIARDAGVDIKNTSIIGSFLGKKAPKDIDILITVDDASKLLNKRIKAPEFGGRPIDIFVTDGKVKYATVQVSPQDVVFKPRDFGIPTDLPKAAPAGGTTDWWSNKESAMTRAREQHALSFPTYDDSNVIDEAMRAIFPFWNYELFRWRWIPRTWMRTPGTMTGLARYVNYTDQGYLPIPATDLQINILRGSVWMGGLRSMYLRDFPEYYDAMPGMELIDYIGRMGFFPGFHVMAPIVLFGATVGGKPELAQLAPAWMRTTLSAMRALSPEHIGAVLEFIYPDRFRDFQTMLTLAGQGYDADEIWRKKKQNQPITEEEEKLWLQAVNKVDGVKGILMQQTGLFRIRPDEYTQIRKSMRLAIEEATGVPVSTQEHIDRLYPVTGKRFSDYYRLDILQQKLLYEFETYRRWQGVTTPLYPSSWQVLDVKIRDYYQEVERVYEDARHLGTYEEGELVRPSMVEINRQLVDGVIGPDQWRAMRSDIQGSLAEAVRVLGESPAYKDVPKTFEERALMLEERGITTPTQGADQELLYYYFELKPEYKWSWEAQRMERDFDTYYTHIDILLESLDAAHRERLIQRIQFDWTPMERLYWQISREHIRPYRNLRSIVLSEYTPEEVQQIRRFEVARGVEREELQQVLGPDGLKLISGFAKRLREARQRFRILDPLTDAWLNFFGTTDKLMSAQAKEIYDGLLKQFLTSEMVE
ncbi:hypothetical protein LCGC14_0591440 [marine sediment metagenome]|uniref:Uncharacterized protein n=1 Tax=marine sediment metagenome TaxID=412755 RepID=A0A0F9RX85_9ZZZZ